MHYEGTTYRPPPEANSLLLQVTVGCAYNKCRFCHMYRDVTFKRVPMDRIEKDLREAREIFPGAERIFLVNGDAFVLTAETLKTIAGKIKTVFPECQTITMHASIRNIQSKTDQELQELKSLGINDLYLGVESGWDDVLRRMNKGYTVSEAYHQLSRLNRAGINHHAILMLGIAGSGQGVENARHTADFLSRTTPGLILLGTLCVYSGTELHADMQQGAFVPASEAELIEEEKTLMESIDQLDISADIMLLPRLHPEYASRQ